MLLCREEYAYSYAYVYVYAYVAWARRVIPWDKHVNCGAHRFKHGMMEMFVAAARGCAARHQ